MGRKETDATDAAGAVDTSHPGLWRTEITYADEPRLHGAYSIPSSVKLRFDTKNKGAMVHENEHEVCVYEDMFEVGFRFPFPRVVREMLHHLQIAPHQLAPNAWWTFFACMILWPRVLGEGHELLVREFLKIYKLSRNPRSEFTFNFQGHQKTKFILLSGYSSNKFWKDKFFFAQGDWEFSATEIVAGPRVPRETHVPFDFRARGAHFK
jgi:hypothetical protein